MPAVVYTAKADAEGSTLYVSQHIERLLGFSREEWLADPHLWFRQVHKDDRERISAEMARIKPEEPPVSYEYRIHRKDGRLVWVRDYVQIVNPNSNSGFYFQGVMVDITAEREILDTLVVSEAINRQLFESLPLPLWIYDLETLRFLHVNAAAMAKYGYSREEFLSMTIRDIRPPDEVPRLMRNVKRVTEGLDDAGVWRHIRKDGSVIEVRITWHTMNYNGRPAKVALVQDITKEITAQRKLESYIAKMEKMTLGTAGALGQVTELRDPYTAGHQHRVGALAASIAEEMGLGAHMTRGLRVAGALHDVGKIAVPAEILVKPSRLTPPEFQLVRAHAQAGYEVLKEIDFPWPVAEVASQHHECIDGSGYPNGLKGEDIAVEARIVAVADSIEAMASHRPYRPSLGLTAALAAIEAGAGTKYDPDIAKAALRLGRRDAFRLPE